MCSSRAVILVIFMLSLTAVLVSPRAAAQDSPAPFYWTQEPVNQKVMISQAAIYPGGYQLLDTAGHTILVPIDYDNRNLYTMEFAVSPDGTEYFVNLGDFPVLYLPADGYLVCGLMLDTRWYPFTTSFRPSQPVFLSITPGFPGFLAMGWYPGMSIYGGFWSSAPWTPGQHFPPTPAQQVIINGIQYNTWKEFRTYWQAHPIDQNFGYYWKLHPTEHPIFLHPNPMPVGQPVAPGGQSVRPGAILFRRGPRPGGQPVRLPPILRRNPRPAGGRPGLRHPILRRR